MTTLNEIEARAKQLWTSYLSGGTDNELAEHDVELLIRAVRQLGAREEALAINFDSNYVLGAIEKRTPIDDDVLALLEEVQRC